MSVSKAANKSLESGEKAQFGSVFQRADTQKKIGKTEP